MALSSSGEAARERIRDTIAVLNAMRREVREAAHRAEAAEATRRDVRVTLPPAYRVHDVTDTTDTTGMAEGDDDGDRMAGDAGDA